MEITKISCKDGKTFIELDGNFPVILTEGWSFEVRTYSFGVEAFCKKEGEKEFIIATGQTGKPGEDK